MSCSAIGLVDPLLERIGQSLLPPAWIYELGVGWPSGHGTVSR